ncbi:MAG: hypothetical protein ACRCRW_16235 [Aeromonadaceae bacterium]
MEVTEKTYFCATLGASGFQAEDVEALTAFLDTPGPLTEERLMADRKLKIAETLSVHWLVNELRARATSSKSSPEAAVEALRILTDISVRVGYMPHLVEVEDV